MFGVGVMEIDAVGEVKREGLRFLLFLVSVAWGRGEGRGANLSIIK